MWTPICTENGLFMIDFDKEETLYKFRLTDLEKLWIQDLEQVTIFQKFQEHNPLIDSTATGAIDEVLGMLKQAQKITLNDGRARVNLETNNSGCNIKFELDLSPASNAEMKKYLTVPLIQTVHFLEKQQEMLVNLLCRKDKEIEQYRMECATISRSDLITEKFEEEVLENFNERLMVKTFGQSADGFMEKLSEEYGEIKQKVIEVPIEPWNNIKRKRKVYSEKTAAKAKNKKGGNK